MVNDVISHVTNGIRQFSVAGVIFSYVQKYFSGFLTEGDRPQTPLPTHPPLTVGVFLSHERVKQKRAGQTPDTNVAAAIIIL